MPCQGTPSPEHLYLLLARAEREGLDQSVTEKLRVILYFVENSFSISETCRHFGISRSTFHRWMDRFDGDNLAALADKSHDPFNVRKSAVDDSTIEIIRRYRTSYVQIGKERIRELLAADHGIHLSASTIGRIIERERLYFADTPLHWKKRMDPRSITASAVPVLPVSEPVAATPLQHIEIRPAPEPVAQAEVPYGWKPMGRFILISSVITNIALVGMLVIAALLDHTSSTPPKATPSIDIQTQEVLHAAPTTVYIP